MNKLNWLQAPRNEAVVVVITSDATWHAALKYCFNSAFSTHRQFFDLAVMYNGDSAEGLSNIIPFTPDYLMQRVNLGLDPVAFDVSIKSLPSYSQYILLHDDHWFHDPDWFMTLTGLLKRHPEIDVFGNLVREQPDEQVHQYFKRFSLMLGYDGYYLGMYLDFIQGFAGIYRRRAIESLLKNDGFPHIHGSGQYAKLAAEMCERLASYILQEGSMKLGQIPPGYDQYLMHKNYYEQRL